MGIFALAAGSGGRWAALPSITYSSYGNFVISNYTLSANYTLTPTSGTATLNPVTGTVALSDTTVNCQIYATAVKGGSPSSTKTYYRQAHTSDPVYGYGSIGWNYEPGNCFYWAAQDGYCRNAQYGNNALVGYSDHDYSPQGFTNAGAGNDWWKVV